MLIMRALRRVCLRSVQRFPAHLTTVSCALIHRFLRSVHRFLYHDSSNNIYTYHEKQEKRTIGPNLEH